jgi:putative toxin-antitoxin system antitoxin component (TIGR02293 family)
MDKKFVSVTLDLDEETFKILEKASAKRGSSVSRVAQELISKALHDSMQSRDGVLGIVEETLRAMGSDKAKVLDLLLALTRKEATQEKHRSVGDAFDEVQMALLALQAGTEVFESEQEFMEWLRYPAFTLGHKIPLSLLSSPAGLQMVIDVLVRIEHGIPS